VEQAARIPSSSTTCHTRTRSAGPATARRPATVPAPAVPDPISSSTAPGSPSAGIGAAGSAVVARTRPATTVTASPSTPAMTKCGNGDKCGASSPPTAAPVRPPRDHAAWKDGITGRRSTATTSTATVLAATFTQP